MQNQNSNIEGQYKTLAIIWFALLMSQFILLGVVFIVKPELFQIDFSKSPLGENPVIPIVFALLAFSSLAMSFVLKRANVNKAIAEQNTALVQTAMIIGCALCEAVSLFGIVLAFAFSYRYFFIWCALGIIGIVLHFPKRDDLVAASYKR